MRTHTQTIDQKPQIGVTVDVGGLEWFHRVCQWFKSITPRQREIGLVSPYGTWDGQRERFQPMLAEASVDIVAARSDIPWSVKIYSTSI
jgi:hypothetical protein